MERYPSQAVGRYNPIIVEGSSGGSVLTDDEQSPLPPQQLYARRRATRSFRRLLLLLPPLFLLLGLSLGGSYSLWWSSATIHLRPVSATQEASITITAALRPTGPAQSQLHLLTSAQSAPTISVQPTGRVHLPATLAGGTLYWYNQEPYQQTVAAGTVLTSSTGIQVVTAAPVVIGAGALPSSGVAKGRAYARQVGASGNIAAGSIDFLCSSCGPGISVNNNADPFTGGRDAATLAALSQGDIDQATALLKSRLAVQALQSLLRMVPRSDKSVAASSCTLRIHANHQPGEQLALGTAVTLSLTESCSVSVYDPGDAQARAIALFLARVGGRFPASQFSSLISAQPQKPTVLGSAAVALPFRVSGRWVYRISPQEQRALQQRIAGQSQQQALQILTHSPGVQQAFIDQPVPWFPLPNDPRRIAIVSLTSSVQV